MPVHPSRSAAAGLRRISVLFLLANLATGALPAALAAQIDLAGAATDGLPPATFQTKAPNAGPSTVAAPGAAATPALGGPAAFAPAPLSLSNGLPQNFTPFAPSPFVRGELTPGPNVDGVNVAALPNITINQTGNVTVGFNGTWNPSPGTAADRDWVLALLVRSGAAQIAVLESNTSVRYNLNASQIPFQIFFALPHTAVSAGATSTARVAAFLPASNLTLLNLTLANAGVSLVGNTAVPQLPTESVWFSASGAYGGSGILNATQNVAILVPADGGYPFELRTTRNVQWTNTSHFPGARFMMLKGAGSVIVVSNFRALVWTRGSPESSLYLNATVTPNQAYRNDTLNVSGTVGNRTLAQSTQWTVNRTAVLGPSARNSVACNQVVRLQNGTYRMFCSYTDNSGPGTQYGVDSAFSADGLKWTWEGGARYNVCSGQHTITQIAIVRLLDGTLRMYYGGADPLLACSLLPTPVHISSATSADEGVTWTLESETLGNFSVASPDVRAVVPTADGRLRMYFDSASGLSSALSDDGLNWAFESAVNGTAPREAYLLTDGSYKSYFGTSTVSSSTSVGGLGWNAPVTEVAQWGIGAIEAGPVLDRGDGVQLLMVYSQSNGMFLAQPNVSVAPGARVDLVGRTSDGLTAGTTSVVAGARGAFQANLTIPPGAPLGRYFVGANAGFGENRFRGIVVNRLPVWSGPAVVNATEDVPLALDLALWVSDGDIADVLQIFANSAYLTLNGTVATLLYPNNILSDSVLGLVSDGHDQIAFSFLVNVTPVNDRPTIALNATYTVLEDHLTLLDFAGAYHDEETPDNLLNLSTNMTGASVAGSVIAVNFSVDGLQNVTIGVNDGFWTVNATTTIIVLPWDDPPILTLAPSYSGNEDTNFTIDFTPAVFDEDTPLGAITLTTNLTNATVGLNVTLNRSLPGSFPFNVTVSDGNSSVTGLSLLIINPVNDAPSWTSAPPLAGVTEDVPFVVDLAPYASDEETLSSLLNFSADSPNASVNGTRLTLLYGEGILADKFNLTVSDGMLSATIQVSLNVTPVNDPPVISNSPPSSFDVNGSLLFQFQAADPDSTANFTFAIVDGPTWIAISPSGLLNITPPAGEHGRRFYNVTVTDSSGAASAPTTFSITLPTNRLPEMLPDFTKLPANAILDTPFTLNFTVVDPDGDTVAVSAVGYDPGQTLTLTSTGGAGWRFSWTPTYPGPHAIPFRAWLNGTLLLNDSFGVARYPFSIRAMDPPSHPPVINGTIGPIKGEVNTNITLDLTQFMSDPDELDTIDLLNWSFEGDVGAVAGYLYDAATHKITFLFTAEKSGSLTFVLSDPSHLEARQLVLVQGIANQTAPPNPGQSPGFPWWLLLIIVGGGIAGTIAYLRTRPGPVAGEPAAPAELAPVEPPAAAPASQPVLATVPADKRKFLVEDVFLLYRDGRTIFTRSGLGADAVEDPESVGAMLIAVQDFVRDSFRKGGPVDRMGYGDNVILLEQGESVLLAVTVFGEPDREFHELLSDTVHNVEANYAGVIEHWSGNRADFVGVEAMLAPLWGLTAHLTRGDVLLATTAREVQMLSGVEFFQGYVRLKVGVVNNTSTVITGVTIDLDYNSDVLRLAKVEPSGYKSSGAKVNLGVLHTGEKATLAYYFDPQICTMSMIDGSVRYKDAEGRQHIVQMKSRKAEVVCPLFFTKEQANTAMLRRLVETELKQFDVRGYSFKEGATEGELSAIFEALKGAVLAHDVQTVRSFERHNPYSAEGWYYGITQVKGYKIVIRAIVDEEKGRAEFFVASTVMRPVTGLLAELHHTFQATVKERLGAVGIIPLFDESLRGTYADGMAVSKMIEGEADAGETDSPQ